MESAIVFLVINDLGELPKLTIESCSKVTSSRIIIGYLYEQDIRNLKTIPNLEFRHLSPRKFEANSSNKYQDFNQKNFFELVTYKWDLILSTLLEGYEVVVYSDLDVYWVKDPVPEIVTLHRDADFDICIQDTSYSPSEPRLCMGFASFRNSHKTKEFLMECEKKHLLEISGGKHVGDDDIVTTYFIEKNFPRWIHPLPQYTFPVGRQLNAYARKNQFAGLDAPVPYIFHSNWVVGLENKILLTKKFAHLITSIDFRIDLLSAIRISLKRKRYEIGTKRLKYRKKPRN